MDSIARKRAQVMAALEPWRTGVFAGRVAAGQVMTAAPSCMAPNVSALELVRMFRAKGFRHLLVTDDRGDLLDVASDAGGNPVSHKYGSAYRIAGDA